MVRKYDYKKMHMISQAMYEKLKKCLENETKDTTMDDYHTSRHTTTDDFHTARETSDDFHTAADVSQANPPFQSYYQNPLPGPSNINPETGEYYEMPEVTPPEFHYDDEPSGKTEKETTTRPSTSFFESTYDGSFYVPPKRGVKTFDPSKYKRSRPNQSKLKLPRGQLFVRQPALEQIPEEVEHESSRISQPEHVEHQTIQRPVSSGIVHDFTITDAPRPMHSSTPKPSFREESFQNLTLSDGPRPLHSSTPIPDETLPVVKTRSQQKKVRQIPLKSCKPKVTVTYSDGDEKIADNPNMGKHHCSLCNKWYSSKRYLKIHTLKIHNQGSETNPNPPELTYENWQQTSGKRTSSQAKLKNYQSKKNIKPDVLKKNKRFDSWNL